MGAGNSTQRSSQKQETKRLTISEILRSVVDSIVLMSDNASPPSVDTSIHFTLRHFTTLIVQYWEGPRDSRIKKTHLKPENIPLLYILAGKGRGDSSRTSGRL